MNRKGRSLFLNDLNVRRFMSQTEMRKKTDRS